MSSSIHKTSLVLLLLRSIPVDAVQTVWSAFAFVLNGERVPQYTSGTGSLTPLGAQQMYSQGSALRSRWLTNTTATGESSNVTSNAPIADVERVAIDNSQLLLYSSLDEYANAGALAFMQGLYPPTSQAFASDNGGINASILANGSLVDFPLHGYMYPHIRTLSASESEAVWLHGQQGCNEYIQATSNVRSDPYLAEMYNSSLSHYQELWSTIFAGTVSLSTANLNYAYDLYEYASYEYTHNETVRQNLSLDDLNWLAGMASIQQFAKNGDLTVSGRQDGDMIRAISGRTLASKVIAQFQQAISSRRSNLSIMFGSYEPMLAFFALSGLSRGPSAELFKQLPHEAGTMVFELFSEGSDSTSFPSINNLWVRFLYRNGTDEDTPLLEYSLFELGNSETSIKYLDFRANIKQFSASLLTWCSTCNAKTPFCPTHLSSNGTSGSSSSGDPPKNEVSPAVAGVIGAFMAIAVTGLAACALAVFGGYRVSRNSPGRKSSLGGFKGAEKMASDRDLSVAKSGVKHERVGSWELAPPGKQAAEPPRIEAAVVATHVRDHDDGDSICCDSSPVEPREVI